MDNGRRNYDENNNIYTETPDSVLHNNIIPATG